MKTPDLFDNERPALLFIPDMSGFTKFIRSTKIQYSKQLIHDLLEVLLDSNILNMKVAEIPGDAIIFYLPGTPPNITRLESQVKKTFMDFRKALIRIEQTHTLLKGACDLTLKIVVHYGCISTTNIKGNIKIVGSDVVLAMRLLKNNIKAREYLLMTRQYLDTQNDKLIHNSFQWSKMMTGKKKYEYFDLIEYKYLLLTPLQKEMKSLQCAG